MLFNSGETFCMFNNNASPTQDLFIGGVLVDAPPRLPLPTPPLAVPFDQKALAFTGQGLLLR